MHLVGKKWVLPVDNDEQGVLYQNDETHEYCYSGSCAWICFNSHVVERHLFFWMYMYFSTLLNSYKFENGWSVHVRQL